MTKQIHIQAAKFATILFIGTALAMLLGWL